MTIKKFIEKAIEGGWKPHKGADYTKCRLVKAYRQIDYYAEKDGSSSRIDVRHMLLSPRAWQSVGKMEGWKESYEYTYGRCSGWKKAEWKTKMHAMIDALAEGKTIEQFLETL